MQLRKIPSDESLWLYKEPEVLEAISPEKAMELASHIALKGVGSVHKNPLVGALFVDKEHRFLAAAAHLVFGQEHAEINLIEKIYAQGLEDKLAESTLYTTLEPCSHYGKTRPCIQALSKLPIKNVVYGSSDPNPSVAGRGIRFLESIGMKCTFSQEFHDMSAPLLEAFKWGLNHKSPFIGLKAALTLNGMAAFPGDQRAWITSERSRNYGHWLRLMYEGILVGANTVIHDNPSLTMRHPHIKGRTPLRIVLDPKGRASLSRPLEEHNLLKSESSKTLWACDESFWKEKSELRKTLENKGVQTLALPKNWNLKAFVNELGARDLASLLIEGGPGTWTSFLKESLVNKVHLFLAPKIYGAGALNFASSLQSSNFDLKNPNLTILENDILVEGDL